MRIEGKRKVLLSSAMYTENLSRTHYTETEIEAIYMGKESKVRKRYQRSGSFNQRRQVSDGRQRSLSRDSRYGRYVLRSRYDRFKSPGRRDDSARRD